jgi:uncharacterized membrane protein
MDEMDVIAGLIVLMVIVCAVGLAGGYFMEKEIEIIIISVEIRSD